MQRQCRVCRRHQLPVNGRCAKNDGAYLIHVSSARCSLGAIDSIAQRDETGFNDASTEDTSRPIGDNSIFDVQLNQSIKNALFKIKIYTFIYKYIK